MREQDWRDYDVNLVGHCEDGIDISVLAAEMQLSAGPPLPLSTIDRAALGQEVYLLGYPFGLNTELGILNDNFPLPFVKKAVLSAQDRPSGIYGLDGHVSHGFSGGPVAFSPISRFAWFRPRARSCSVGAVISGYLPEKCPVWLDEKRTSLYINHNLAIVSCHDIKYAIDVIRQNPIGFEL